MAAKPRSTTKNADDPRGKFGSFLRHWIDKHHDGDESRLASTLGVSPRAVRKWCEGTHGPKFERLDDIASAMNLGEWTDLAAACRSFHRKK